MFKLFEVVEMIKCQEKPFYVYVLYKPNSSPFYVGKGKIQSKDQRITYHECEAKSAGKWKSSPHFNRHKINTIKKIWAQEQEVLYAIDSWHETEKSVNDREKELIASIGRQCIGTGPLTNLMEGGENEQSTITLDSKEQISQSLKEFYLEHPEALEAMSKRGREQFLSIEAREKLRQRAIDNNSAEYIKKWLKEVPAEVLEKKFQNHSEFMKEWHQTEDGKEKTRQTTEKRNAIIKTEEHRKYMRERTRQYNLANPEAHKARRDKAKATVAAQVVVRQQCYRIIQDDLLKRGQLKKATVSVSSHQIGNWKRKGKISDEMMEILKDAPHGGDWSHILEKLRQL